MSRRLFLAGGLTAVSAALTGCAGGKPAEDVSGRAVRWKKTFDVAIRMPMSPTTLVVAGERLYVTHEGELVAFAAATGTQLWRSAEGTQSDESWVTRPVVEDGMLLLLRETWSDLPGMSLDRRGVLHAIDAATGTPRWQYGTDHVGELRNRAWPAAAGGVVCYSGIDTYAALDIATGRKLWSRQHDTIAGPLPFGAPVMTASTIYLPDMAGRVSALEARTGKLRWKEAASEHPPGQPCLALGGGLLVSYQNGGLATRNSRITAYDAATGAQRWSTSSDASFNGSSPVIGGDSVLLIAGDTVLLTGGEDTVIALGLADGRRRWSFTTAGKVGGATVADNTAYVSSKHTLYALNLANGANRWTLRSSKATFSMPAVSNGLVHVFALAPDGTYITDTLYAVPV